MSETPDSSRATIRISGRQRRQPSRIDKQLMQSVGAEMRKLFEDVASEPVPPKLLQLLEKLKRERPRNGGAEQ